MDKILHDLILNYGIYGYWNIFGSCRILSISRSTNTFLPLLPFLPVGTDNLQLRVAAGPAKGAGMMESWV